VLFAAVVLGIVGLTLRLAKTRYAWVAAAAGVVLATPRFFVYDVTYLLIGVQLATMPGPRDHVRQNQRRT
jgi:hypothetical protein